MCMELSRERGVWTPDQVYRAEGKKAWEDSRSGGKPPPAATWALRDAVGTEGMGGPRGSGDTMWAAGETGRL